MEWWEESLPSLGNPFMPPCSTKARCCWLGWGLPRAHTHTHPPIPLVFHLLGVAMALAGTARTESRASPFSAMADKH